MTEDSENYGFQRKMLVKRLVGEGFLRTVVVIEAISRVPRELFVPEHLRRYAYSDSPLPTGRGQTISAPHDRLRRKMRSGETWSPS